MLGEIDWELSSRALAWLAENQLPNGAWGACAPMYYHDRVLCTLAAMIALSYRGRRGHDKVQIENGKRALERMVKGATEGLMADPNGATVGFEMIAPTLVAEAEKLGIIKRQGDRILGRLSRQRAKKLSFLKDNMISRHVTMAFSAEMAGTDGKHMLDIKNLQESNGSVGVGFVVGSAVLAGFSIWLLKVEGTLKFIQSIRYIESTIWVEPHSFDMPTISGIIRRNFTLTDPTFPKAFVWLCYLAGITGFSIWWHKSREIGERQIGLIPLAAIFLLPYAHYHVLTLLLIPIFCLLRVLERQGIVQQDYLVLLPLLVSWISALGYFGWEV